MAELSADAKFVLHHMLSAYRIGRDIDHSLAGNGVSFREFLVLYQLFRTPDRAAPPKNLAESLSMTAIELAKLIKTMEKERLIQKQTDLRDVRRSVIALTESGACLFDDVSVGFNDFAEYLVGNVF